MRSYEVRQVSGRVARRRITLEVMVLFSFFQLLQHYLVLDHDVHPCYLEDKPVEDLPVSEVDELQ